MEPCHLPYIPIIVEKVSLFVSDEDSRRNHDYSFLSVITIDNRIYCSYQLLQEYVYGSNRFPNDIRTLEM